MNAFFNTGLSQQEFLTKYWQKRPLLIRQAWPDFDPMLTVDELAGLACEEDIESRLIQEQGAEGPWQCRHGPFSDYDFATLPSSHWTLLVQDVDKHVPELATVMQRFTFIPDWRRDDLMVSYAPIGGSVGPHTDGYDVFLLQAKGTRRWQISHEPMGDAAFIDGLDLRILEQFEPDASWDLEPGDMLYLPPHFAHHGVALNDCMTFSIGFRAPTQMELLDALMQSLSEHHAGESRYRDPGLHVAEQDLLIDPEALLRFKQCMISAIEQSDKLVLDAVGRLLTETKPSLQWLAEECSSEAAIEIELSERILAGEELVRNPYLRLAYAEHESKMMLFAAGEALELDDKASDTVAILTGKEPIGIQQYQTIRLLPGAIMALLKLIELGVWTWEDSDT